MEKQTPELEGFNQEREVSGRDFIFESPKLRRNTSSMGTS